MDGAVDTVDVVGVVGVVGCSDRRVPVPEVGDDVDRELADLVAGVDGEPAGASVWSGVLRLAAAEAGAELLEAGDAAGAGGASSSPPAE